LRYDILEKLGEGNKGEVYKVKLENGKIAALKWAKNYEIEKEWEILNYLDGFYAPKPIKRGNKYFIMELIEGKALKEFLDTPQYYYIIQKALIGAYELDLRKVTHSQLGRFFHIIYNEDKKDIKFIDFERASFSEKPRNFMQIIGYYLHRDKLCNKEFLKDVVLLYKEKSYKAVELIVDRLNNFVVKFQ